MMRVIDLDSALQARVHIGLGDLTVEEFRALQVLRFERDKYSEEKSRRG